jgi:hypothetical protein
MNTTTIVNQLIEKHGDNVFLVWGDVKAAAMAHPNRPSQPRYKHSGASAAELKEAAVQMEQYEKEIKQYDAAVKTYRNDQAHQNQIMEDYLREVSGLNKNVPEQYRDKVYAHAHETGHSYGFTEIYAHLTSLIEIFE